MVQLDLKNAFNGLDRTYMAAAVKKHAPDLFHAAKWSYGSTTKLFYLLEDGSIEEIKSSQGLREGVNLRDTVFSGWLPSRG